MPVLTVPFAAYVGLYSDAKGMELAGRDYARQPATFVYCADGITVANPVAIEWRAATWDWSPVTQAQLWDSPTGGSILYQIGQLLLPEPVVVPQYAIARIPPAGLALTLNQHSRPYGVGPYGVGPYGTYNPLEASSVNLLITFDTTLHQCGPGAWLPGPFRRAA